MNTEAVSTNPNGGELSDTEINNSSVKVLAFRWLSRQGVVVVLLFTLLGGFSWFGHYTMTIAVPQHLKTIQEGYERIGKSHDDALGRVAGAVEKIADDNRLQRKEFLDLIREQK